MAKTSTFPLSVVAAATFALFSSLGLSGCGGGGSDPVSPPVQSEPAKALSADITPKLDATDVPLISPVGVPFDKALYCDGKDVSEKVGTFGDVSGTATCVSRRATDRGAFTIVPSAPYLPARRYTYKISGLKDRDGLVIPEVVGSFTTVAATPPPPKLSYENVVVMRWRFSAWLDVVDRTVPGGYLPIVNKTPWPKLYSLRIRSPRSDCLMEVAGYDGMTGEKRRALLNVVSRELIADPSPALLDHDLDFMSSTPYDPVNHPTWAVSVQNPDGWYYAPGVPINVWFLDNAGVSRQITNTTFDATAEVLGLWSFSCTAQ